MLEPIRDRYIAPTAYEGPCYQGMLIVRHLPLENDHRAAKTALSW